MAPLRHSRHTDHLATIVVFPVTIQEVNHLEDQLGEVQMVVVGQVEGLVGILDQGLEDQHLHQETQVLDLMDHHILQENPGSGSGPPPPPPGGNVDPLLDQIPDPPQSDGTQLRLMKLPYIDIEHYRWHGDCSTLRSNIRMWTMEFWYHSPNEVIPFLRRCVPP